jgi:hypothetical protein
MTISLHPSLGKDALFAEGVARARSWLESHGLPQPHHLFSSMEEANRFRRGFVRPNWFGAHIIEDGQSAIAVSVKKCRVATRVPGWSWTYPGYKADLTPYGVICHEFGHHVDHVLGGARGISKRKAWNEVINNEEEISGYEPNCMEAFAEAFRLFLTNPGLLKEGRPERWEYFTETLKLTPPHSSSWKTVLKHAHPRIISAAERWIADR